MTIRNVVMLFTFAGVVSIAAQPGTGDGQPGRMPMMPPPDAPMGLQGTLENHGPMMMNLSELQKLMAEISIDKTISVKIITITRTFLKTLDERILKIQREEINIKEELLKDIPDLQAVQAAINRKTTVFGEIEFLQIKRDLDIKSLLTVDEYDRWKSAMKQKMRPLLPSCVTNPAKPENSKTR